MLSALGESRRAGNAKPTASSGRLCSRIRQMARKRIFEEQYDNRTGNLNARVLSLHNLAIH
jgi:hypothetical protein